MKDILVIDSPESRAFWKNIKSGCSMFFADTAGQGLAMLSDNIGIVFLSKNLPDMNGLDALSLIKKSHPSTAVIVISSFGTEETCLEAFRKGARDYLKRPLNADEILAKVNILENIKNDSQRRRHLSLALEAIPDESYPNIPSHLVEKLLRVRDFVGQNYSESLTLSAACKMATISKTYFCRFFKTVTGHSLRHYHHVVRVRIAEELLQDKRLSITDVAIRLGYNDSNYFSTIYKKINGVSPRQRQAFDQYPSKTKWAEIAEKENQNREKQYHEFPYTLTPRQGLPAMVSTVSNYKGGIGNV